MISKENEKTGIQTDSSCEGTPYIELQHRHTGITPWVFREGGGGKDQRQNKVSVWEVWQELERVKDTPSKTKCGSGKKQKNSTVVTDQMKEDHNQQEHYNAEDLLLSGDTQTDMEEEQGYY